MSGFIEGADRSQASLFPERLEDWICEDNPVRIVDVFVVALDLSDLGFSGIVPANTERPGYHPSVLLKLFIYGHLNRVPSSRRLEREANRNVEVMWRMGRLAPDHKLPHIERICDPKDLRAVHRTLSPHWRSKWRMCCHRWQKIQDREQPGPKLHTSKDRAAYR